MANNVTESILDHATTESVTMAESLRIFILSKSGDIQSLFNNAFENYAKFASTVDEGDSVGLTIVRLIGSKIYSNSDRIIGYAHEFLLVVSILIVVSYASLGPPSSAGPPISNGNEDEDEDEDEDENLHKPIITMGSSYDAYITPFYFGILLITMNKMIKWYPNQFKIVMSLFCCFAGIQALTTFATDGLNVLYSFVFPSKWHSKGNTYHVDHLLSQQFVYSRALHRKVAGDKTTPFPGPLSNSTLLTKFSSSLWNLRALFNERWTLRAYVHERFRYRSHVRMNDAIGFGIAVVAVILWITMGRPWQLTNLIGVALCYLIIQSASPTKFSDGIVLLIGMLIYDVVMVYYTENMEKFFSAMKDTPTSLTFPSPNSSGSALGLGDILLPGSMVAFALRFDLYLYYLRKQTIATYANPLKGRLRSSTRPNSQVTTTIATHIIKAPYVEVTGKWGEWFWTLGAPKQDRPDFFPKVYFKACLYGYVYGLFISGVFAEMTLKTQPALLFIVPSVLISLGLTVLCRGEIGLMLSYSEAGAEQEDESSNANTSVNNNRKSSYPRSVSFVEEQSWEQERKTSSLRTREPSNEGKGNQDQEDLSRHILLFSLTKPKRKAKDRLIIS